MEVGKTRKAMRTAKNKDKKVVSHAVEDFGKSFWAQEPSTLGKEWQGSSF